VYWAIVAAAHGLEYYRTNRERELRASQLEARLAQARLQLLQMQLHPHFLFNTLHTVSEIVHEDPDVADRMITGLSELLGETLIAGDVQQVPLHRELELLERYLEIQQARFGDRLRVDVAIEPPLGDALVPHFVLQPLVENAIRHGLGCQVDAGHIRIEARRDEGVLVLEVRDDGRGLGPSPWPFRCVSSAITPLTSDDPHPHRRRRACGTTPHPASVEARDRHFHRRRMRRRSRSD
jgi:LytS/YehU family sensor histidine kinase